MDSHLLQKQLEEKLEREKVHHIDYGTAQERNEMELEGRVREGRRADGKWRKDGDEHGESSDSPEEDTEEEAKPPQKAEGSLSEDEHREGWGSYRRKFDENVKEPRERRQSLDINLNHSGSSSPFGSRKSSRTSLNFSDSDQERVPRPETVYS